MFKRSLKTDVEKEFTHPSRSHQIQDEQVTIRTTPPTFQHQEAETTIGPTVSIRGVLAFNHSLKIEGSFEGELISEGRLHIGPEARVKADITLESAIIEGELQGNICVQGHLEIKKTALIKGDITAKTLSVETGAEIAGNILVKE